MQNAADASMAAATAPPVLNRTEQQRNFGIDCGDAIHFEAGSWLPGGEHVKKITVKNVSRRTIKFKYELPTTKYFSMDFPTLITLSPGMLTVLDVAFRPVKCEEYDDFVTFHVKIVEGGVAAFKGDFRLPVMARIAGLSIEVPQGIDFGFCPTAETTSKSFLLRNNGQIDALFEWSVPGAGEHGCPFAVHPPSGRVGVGEAAELTATFCPSCASVYVVTTQCFVRTVDSAGFTTAQQQEQTMKLSGISKFTHIAASETELVFGEVLVGSACSPNRTVAPAEKEFVLRNRSLVRATFQIQRMENDCESVFFFSPTSGVIEPESSVPVHVKYTPLSAGTFTCDHFDIVTPGGNRERITCKGRAMGPLVSLWKKNLEANFVPTKSVNFRDVALGQSTSRVLTLRNSSPMEVFFHFDCQNRGVFAFDVVNGSISPLLDRNVTITFTPTRPGNFYRRFFLMIQNQSTLFIDVLATGYDDKVRPSPFQQAHVDAYHARMSAGLGLLGPDELETHWQDNGDDLFLQGALRRAATTENSAPAAVASDQTDGAVTASRGGGKNSTSVLPPLTQLLTRSGEATMADVAICQEYFVSVEDKANPMAVVGAWMDFGNCSIVQFPSKKVLHVKNNTHAKVTCSWRVSSATASASSSSLPGKSSPIFQVFPDTQDISAGATAEFRVAFQPVHENSYYFAELEGFISFKSNRTFRLVNVETFTPPWCAVAKVWGNTFSSPIEQFVPKIHFRLAKKRKVMFPPCYLGDQVFQTIMIENASDTPALFSFVEDTTQTFTCKPSSGYIPANSFHLVQIRFVPRTARRCIHMLECIVNNARTTPEILELVGCGEVPRVLLHDEYAEPTKSAPTGTGEMKVYIKPTAVGLLSTRSVELQNASRVPLVFRWDVPRQYEGIFRVTPKLGRLNGKESVLVAYQFTPRDTREYACRCNVLVKPISLAWPQLRATQAPTLAQSQTQITVLQEATVRLLSKGTVDAIVFDPSCGIRFDTILVNTSCKKTFFLVNTADCDLEFFLTQTVKTSCSASAESKAVAQIAFSEANGEIPARSRKQITATFLARTAGTFEFEVRCHIANTTQAMGNHATTKTDRHSGATRLHVGKCVMHAEASFPSVIIEDLRASQLPTALAWHQFLCQEINEYLSAPLSNEEADTQKESGEDSSQMGTSNRLRLPHDAQDGDDSICATFPIRHVAVPFSPSPLGSAPQRVYLTLKNPGNLVVSFSLRYPKEGDVEMEHWAETGAPSSEELRMNAIIDSKVFSISPRRATLLPRQSVTITFAYAYTCVAYGGIHDLPMTLQVEKGRSMILELQGRTLPRNEPKLFLPQRVFHLSPVIIGEFRPSFQVETCSAAHEDDWSDNKENLRGACSLFSPSVHPPVQQLAVFNRGESAFRLEVSSNSFTKINNESKARFPILRCRTTCEIVPANSGTLVDIEFNPIEAKTIEANLILKAHGLMGQTYKEVTMVTVLATGYHPFQTTLEALRRELALSKGCPPPKQLTLVPAQSARFERDQIEFNHVPMYAQTTRLLVLINEVTMGGTVRFEWDRTHPLVSRGVLHFAPLRGELAPGEELLVRVMITTTNEALVVDHDVACVITPLDPSSGSATASSSVSGSLPSAASPTRGSMGFGNNNSVNVEPVRAPRKSVIERSTATQEAAGQKYTRTGATGATGGGVTAIATMESSLLSSSSPPQAVPYPLHAHIYAHVLPRQVMERFYPREILRILPPPLVPAKEQRCKPSTVTTPLHSKSSSSSSTSSIGGFKRTGSMSLLTGTTARVDPAVDSVAHARTLGKKELAHRNRVVVDIMEALVADVLQSDAVQEAVDYCLEPIDPAERATMLANPQAVQKRIYPLARQSNDCQAILAGIMENTVFNIVQELFHSDIESELRCVPRKVAFPSRTTTVSPSKAAAIRPPQAPTGQH